MRIDSLLHRFGGNAPKKGEPVAPPVLEGALRIPYGPFQFKSRLPKGVSYQVHASRDLRTWIPVNTGTAGAEGLDYLDSDASKFNHRFYRLIAADLPSINVLGYVSITLPPGFSLIANPLDASSNAVGELFKGWPDGTSLNRFDTRLFRLTDNAVQNGKWTHPAEQLLPGHGAIFFNPTQDYRTISFSGEVMQGSLSIPIPSGFSVRSSIVPQPGHLIDDLGFPIAEGDVIHIFDRDRQKYVLHPYENGQWKAGSPILSIGESFWVAKTSPGNWTRNFHINDKQPE